jgi:hypothetical protein
MSRVLPDLADEIESCLREDDQLDLADQIGTLRVWGRCPCGDDFCSSFYTGRRTPSKWSDEGEYRTVPLSVTNGLVNLDVVGGVIRHVEVLDRHDIADIVASFPALARG